MDLRLHGSKDKRLNVPRTAPLAPGSPCRLLRKRCSIYFTACYGLVSPYTRQFKSSSSAGPRASWFSLSSSATGRVIRGVVFTDPQTAQVRHIPLRPAQVHRIRLRRSFTPGRRGVNWRLLALDSCLITIPAAVLSKAEPLHSCKAERRLQSKE